jgi:PIN domain nuclease of toxin-antitoxin system
VKLLLDTCTFLWVLGDDPALSPTARAAFTTPENEVYLSPVSTWEILLKHGLGRIELPAPADRFLTRQRELHGIQPLPLDEEAVMQLPKLPALHKDPFDRMLVCQAIAHGLVVLTPDQAISRYPVRVHW